MSADSVVGFRSTNLKVSITACVEFCLPGAVSFMGDALSSGEHRGHAEISACVTMKFSMGGTQAISPEGDAKRSPVNAEEVDGPIVVEVGVMDDGLSVSGLGGL